MENTMSLNFSPNPASRLIIRAAKDAYRDAGPSVQGQLLRWVAVPPDPGKTVFWRDAMVECGMAMNAAINLVDDLDRAKRGW
jgi:hypothetical protein